MSLTTKQKAEQYGWKTTIGKDGKEMKLVKEPAGITPTKTVHKEDLKMETKEETIREKESIREQGEYKQIPTDYWIGKTHSGKDLILVLKGISKDEAGNPIDRVFFANPRDVRDVINGDWSGARLRELVRNE